MIPANLIRTVPAETTDEVESWWHRFFDLHPTWTGTTYRDPIPPEQFPWTAPHWDRCTTGAQRAGLIRLEALWIHGGIYVDSDVEPVRSLEPLRRLDGFAAWEDDICVPDAVLGFTPQHDALTKMIPLAIERLDEGAWESGPGVMTEVLPDRDDVLLLPPGTFFPYHYTEKHRRHEDFSRLPWVFAVHHWAGSWLPTEVPDVPAVAG